MNRIYSVEQIATKQEMRVPTYARSIFRMWVGALLHHIVWWDSGHVILDRRTEFWGWTQGASILLCVFISFFLGDKEKAKQTSTLKWVMITLAFLPLPWRSPWYLEPVIVTLIRALTTLVLFVLQVYKGYVKFLTDKHHSVDLFLIRVGWVFLVHPILVVFAFICFLFYGYTLTNIQLEKTPLGQDFPIHENVQASSANHKRKQIPYSEEFFEEDIEDDSKTSKMYDAEGSFGQYSQYYSDDEPFSKGSTW